jgi:prepilin-type N-terminal cleavage/methylation domain-containing protein
MREKRSRDLGPGRVSLRESRTSRRGGAFTLIELLVVIAIISVLVAMLIPALTQARALFRLTACQSNQRNAGTAWLTYAESHQGRFPGYALSTVEYWGPCWMNILNREYYRNNDPRYYPTSAYGDEPTCGPLVRFWNFWDTGVPKYYDNKQLGIKYMCCPEYRGWGMFPGAASNVWSRPWIANNYVVGNHYDWLAVGANDANGFGGMILPNPQSVNPAYYYYILGNRRDAFVSPSSKYMMWEAEAGRDQDRYTGLDIPVGSGKLLLDVAPNRIDQGRAEWTAAGGDWAFRHLLGVNQALWQQKARAPALYVDGHVQVLNPNTSIHLDKYFRPGA